MKKVLFVATVVQKHINVFHLPYLKLFQDHGYRTYVAASNDTESRSITIPYCDEYVEIQFKRNPLHPMNLPAYFKLKKLIQSNDFDVIHCHTPVGGLLGRLAARKARKKGTRVFYTAHGFHFYKGAPLKNWLFYYPTEKTCSFFTDVLITINQEDYALAKKKMKAARVEYVPGVGVDLSRFENVQVDKAAKRREVGVPEEAVLLVSVGELSERKNHMLILQAISEIDNENIHYMIVGNGSLQSELKKFSEKHNIADRVHFTGYRQDIAELYKISDICCFPSVHEGLPVALMEAMASGLPVVCSRIRGNTDLIDDGVGGLLFDSHSVEDCRRAIVKILENDRARMGEVNRANVKRYSIEPIVAQMKKIYES